ncbi:dienelactone hydrolase family protein [Kibdelosporangium aridum]|uniref:Dienelactone hydrolase family protein n=1 Tax=Kibdelosporangium aridum TaxID=2030 RepID=A0A428ZEC9_KIBAR|nr:dienelactone hydrolase family protein [Kibdelosporangium aridum]RSM86328.1 dienelactone hydrolase family protein [Kibdelosporangium aridum]
MTEIQRYLAEEVAEDLADGIINRREAIRRLGLLGVTGAAASGMLATFAAGNAVAEPADQVGERSASETNWAPVARESITFAGPRVPLMAAWAPAVKPRGAVLVIHENRGLNEHIRTVAGRFAASGYSALALDLLSEEGGTGAFPGEAEVAAALSRIPPERFVADMKASLTELKRRVRGKKLCAVGYCFGGNMVWRLLTSNEPRLAAGAAYYGPFPEGGTFAGSRAAVLGVYGGLDARVNATRPAARAALEAARLKHELLTFTEADHAFFNDTGARFNAHAATEVWRRTLNWFDAADKRHD